MRILALKVYGVGAVVHNTKKSIYMIFYLTNSTLASTDLECAEIKRETQKSRSLLALNVSGGSVAGLKT